MKDVEKLAENAINAVAAGAGDLMNDSDLPEEAKQAAHAAIHGLALLANFGLDAAVRAYYEHTFIAEGVEFVDNT